MAEFSLVAVWRFDAPLAAIYSAVCDPLRWPQWWPDAEGIAELSLGADDGVGRRLGCTWRSFLPYRLRFEICTTRIEPFAAVEGDIRGDIEGTGRCLFSEADGVTTVRHEWRVRTTRPWMNALSPCTDALFARNHALAMRRAGERLAQRLGARLLDFEHRDLFARPGGGRQEAAAAAGAGLFAGVAATLLQAALWRVSGIPVLDTFLRDARLTAAMLMGPEVLPPPPAPDWSVVLVAACVHFGLSIGYGLLLAALIRRLSPSASLLAGAAFGAFLYVVNLYGFTSVFPWMAVTRGWRTVLVHLAFGTALAGGYQCLRGRRLGT